MARFGAPLLTDVIRGKIGGVVFAKARSGPTIRVRVRPANPNTTRQSEVRAALTNAARGYKDLSSTDAEAWRFAATGISLPNGVGGQFQPSGINYYTQLTAVFLAVTPSGTPPTTPPSSPYTGDTIGVAGAGGVGVVTFDPTAANTAGSTTELLVARLPAPNRLPRPGDYRVEEYHVFTGGADVVSITEPAGYYALAYRFVEISTGQRGPLVVLGTFQVT